MARKNQFVIALYAPRTDRARDALASHLEAAGLQTAIRLPDPAPVWTLPYGVLPVALFRLALANGKQPARKVADAAVNDAYAKLKTEFGEAALELNGRLIGSIPSHASGAESSF